MNRIWRIKAPQPELNRNLAESLGISRIAAQLLINRGIKDEMQAHHFLSGSVASLHEPFLFSDMEKSVSRIKRAIKEKENILIYGDYDVDGITSAALLKKVLTHLKASVTAYIPNRLEEGYGLNTKAIKLIHQRKNSLIITVDCGISANEEVALANRLGMDVIITDHHEIKDLLLPDAHSIINPLKTNCNYPFKHLAGVGLAYKLAEALVAGTTYPIEDHMDLVALGTVCDVSPQNGENRILTKCGLEKLTNTKNKGLKALIDTSGLKGRDISSSHIGFILGPRINAMGRIGSPDVALNLLMTDDDAEAVHLAGILNRENRNRRKIESAVLKEVLEKLEREINFKDTKVIVLSGRGWHPGVIGIVASRIVDRYYRPTIVITLNGRRGKGSGRSIDNFHLFNAISASKKHLVNFGGHEMACGLVIEKKNITGFTDDINKFAADKITDRDLYPTLNIDMEIALSELTEGLVNELHRLAPFGPENPRPVFASSELYLKREPRRIAKNGFKMWVTDEVVTCEAVNFRAQNMHMPAAHTKLNLAYSPSINTWQGVSSLQLDLRDLKTVS